MNDVEELFRGMSWEEAQSLLEELPPSYASAVLDELGPALEQYDGAHSPAEQAARIVETFKNRPHIAHISDRIKQAVKDVEAGHDRKLIIELPPRSGKTFMATQVAPAWMLSKHPDWPVIVSSYSGTLATSWTRQIRRWVEEGKLGSAVTIPYDSRAASQWDTEQGGRMIARSVREGVTGEGAKVLVIDDPHKDFADAHSKVSRDQVWNWWLSVGSTRLHPPSLVIVIMTRWHSDDLVGRLLSDQYPGDPADWEVIRLPAIAEENDQLGRTEGQPLYSPLIDETEQQAIHRWADVKQSSGSYVWSALYQQRPAPATGGIFNIEDFRYWTTDPKLATQENVTLWDPSKATGGKWIDSWDLAFTGDTTSDYVVGQRWTRQGPNRYLVDQRRGKWEFTQQIRQFKQWTQPEPINDRIGYRLVEKAANGAALINTLQQDIAGIKPVKPTGSKQERAIAVTPEIESGHVYLPHPSQHSWVQDLIDELRDFPTGSHDDQIDALSQALWELRSSGRGHVTIPSNQRQQGGSRLSRPL